jgi:hypothetical protein
MRGDSSKVSWSTFESASSCILIFLNTFVTCLKMTSTYAPRGDARMPMMGTGSGLGDWRNARLARLRMSAGGQRAGSVCALVAVRWEVPLH